MSKSRDIADSAATINYIDTVTSNVQDQIDNIDPLPSQTGNAGNYLTTDGTNASWGEIASSPTLEAVASGTLSNGDAVIVNSDGTVSAISGSLSGPAETYPPVVFEQAAVIYTSATFDSNSNKVVIAYRDGGNSGYGTAIVGTVSGTSISFGIPVVFESANTLYTSATFDSNSNKVVIAYQDVGNANKGTAIVGTVNGTSISFGSSVVFETGGTEYISATFDSNSNKVVIVYRDDSNSSYGTAVVGTVSGTSISFGSVVVFNSDTTLYSSAAFDSNLNKVVVSYYDGGNDNYGTSIVGTVSGTSISFGSETVFNSASTFDISTTFDSNSNKVVISYTDGGNSNRGTAVVGTVSGTSISFGSETVFNSSRAEYQSAKFDSSSNKVVIAYMDSGNSNYGTAVVGTVSGTSISFGSETVFESSSSKHISTAFEPDSKRVVIVYQDDASSDYGTALVFESATPVTTLTSGNYIGISDADYSDAENAKIQIVGSIDDAQSGLTAGQAYYVKFDGTLVTTPTDPSVFAGTAVSATKLIVKG